MISYYDIVIYCATFLYIFIPDNYIVLLYHIVGEGGLVEPKIVFLSISFKETILACYNILLS